MFGEEYKLKSVVLLSSNLRLHFQSVTFTWELRMKLLYKCSSCMLFISLFYLLNHLNIRWRLQIIKFAIAQKVSLKLLRNHSGNGIMPIPDLSLLRRSGICEDSLQFLSYGALCCTRLVAWEEDINDQLVQFCLYYSTQNVAGLAERYFCTC
jgi:hypothetical protein